MALETALHTAYLNLCVLREALVSLHTTAVEDKPLQGDVVLVEVFGDAADDLLGLLDEALVALAGQQTDDAHARRTLLLCQHHFNQIAQRFGSDLLSYERIVALKRFGRRRGGAWQGWAINVKAALDGCQQPLFDSNQALFACWQALTERAMPPPVHLHATIDQPAALSAHAATLCEDAAS
jgi:hypothetical protein